MPKFSVEGTIGLVLAIVVAILDRLPVRNRFVVWFFSLVAFGLISDAVYRSEWASSPAESKTRLRKRLLGIAVVIVSFALFGALIYRCESGSSTVQNKPGQRTGGQNNANSESLRLLADNLRAQGRIAESCAKREEALKLQRQLVQEDSETYLPKLAATLSTLGRQCYPMQSRTNDAENALNESVRIWRGLPDTYFPNLAGTLIVLAGC